MGKVLKRTMNRLGEPVIRTATMQAIADIGRAVRVRPHDRRSAEAAQPERAKGITHSFDMLGEAANDLC